jgi:two-component system nitrogen regulation sensor histidine kinase NtrY
MAYVALALIAASSLAAAVLLGLRARRLAGDAGRRALDAETRAASQSDELRHKEALLRGLVESSPAAMVLFTDAGRITFTNAAARTLFFEDAHVEGQNFLAMVERAPEALRQSLLSTGSELFTTEGPDGTETFHLSKQRLETQTLIAVRNVTREIGRKENAALKKVIRIIGHEINNSLGPISSLVASARMILARPEHLPKLGTVFDTIDERARHLRAFLDEYGKLARLPKPRPVSVPWGPFLEGVRALWPALKVENASKRPGHLDPAQIQQVIINLVKNAYEAAGSDSEVGLTVEMAQEGGFRITVLDRGPGMSDEALQSALYPFYTTKPDGSGLGLALCREIVDQHQGRLTLARRDGGGMAVSFWLPDAGADAGAAASRARLTLTRA